MPGNRNPIKQWFITFPQCDGVVTKETFCSTLPKSSANMVAQETHEDGSPHLHAILVFENAISKTNLLIHLKKVYPNDWKRIHIAPIKSMNKSIAYINKEDPQPLKFGPLNSKDRKIEEFFKREQERILTEVRWKCYKKGHILTHDPMYVERCFEEIESQKRNDLLHYMDRKDWTESYL